MFYLYKTGKLDPESGSVTRARMNFLKQRLEEAEGSGDTRLISEDEIFELEGLTKKFRKEDLEFKVQEQPERKLTDEEIQELKNLDDDPDFDMADGGRINFQKGSPRRGLGSLGAAMKKPGFVDKNYVDKIVTDNLEDIKNYFMSKYSIEIANQKFNEYLNSLTRDDVYDEYDEKKGYTGFLKENFTTKDGKDIRIPYKPDRNLDIQGLLQLFDESDKGTSSSDKTRFNSSDILGKFSSTEREV